MSTIAIILASGEQTRWERDNTIGVTHKQLIELDGETLIARMVRQSRDRGVTPIVITHHPAIENATNAHIITTAYRRWTCETLRSALNIIPPHDRTIVLLGDVVYSRFVMDRIFASERRITVFGNELEIYAISFYNQCREKVIKALTAAINQDTDVHSKGKLRKFYLAYCGMDLDSPEIESEIMDRVCWVGDYTRDFDTPDEHDDFIKRRLSWLDDRRER